MDDRNEPGSGPPRYRWPWILLALLLLGAGVAVFSIASKARSLRQQREPYLPSGTTGTNAAFFQSPRAPAT